jgi:hypothetical protein
MPGTTLRKCFELSGVVPLSVFVVVHVLSYSQVLFGRAAFGVTSGGAWTVLECLLVWLPLAFHSLVGLRLSTEPLEPVEPERSRSWLLRGSGALSVPFIAAHAFWFRWPLLRGELTSEDLPQLLAARLASTLAGVPLTAALHLVGLALVSLHLALGLPRFLARWGVLSARPARGLGLGLAALMFALGAASIIELATGSLLPRFLV